MKSATALVGGYEQLWKSRYVEYSRVVVGMGIKLDASRAYQ